MQDKQAMLGLLVGEGAHAGATAVPGACCKTQPEAGLVSAVPAGGLQGDRQRSMTDDNERQLLELLAQQLCVSQCSIAVNATLQVQGSAQAGRHKCQSGAWLWITHCNIYGALLPYLLKRTGSSQCYTSHCCQSWAASLLGVITYGIDVASLAFLASLALAAAGAKV